MVELANISDSHIEIRLFYLRTVITVQHGGTFLNVYVRAPERLFYSVNQEKCIHQESLFQENRFFGNLFLYQNS